MNDRPTPETDALCDSLQNMEAGNAVVRLWEKCKKLERERDELREAARNLLDVQGRYHTQQAMERLFNLLP